MPRATIASFILRFTRESELDAHDGRPSGPSDRAWRGVIRHVQTTEEMHFAHMADALSFIARYVDIVEEEGGRQAAESQASGPVERGPVDGI